MEILKIVMIIMTRVDKVIIGLADPSSLELDCRGCNVKMQCSHVMQIWATSNLQNSEILSRVITAA